MPGKKNCGWNSYYVCVNVPAKWIIWWNIDLRIVIVEKREKIAKISQKKKKKKSEMKRSNEIENNSIFLYCILHKPGLVWILLFLLFLIDIVYCVIQDLIKLKH